MLPESAGIVRGDALDPESALAACRGAEIVYDCVNVRYSEWVDLLPRIRANVLAAARDSKARLVLTDNVYAYGPLRELPAGEDHPRAATSKKGRLRAEFERMLLDAHARGDLRVVIARYPDYYGPYVLNPLMRPIFESALAGKTATWPVSLDVPHDLVYVEDAAEAAISLSATEDAFGQVWHVPGPGPITGRQFLTQVFQAAGHRPRMRAVGQRLFKLFGVFIPDAGEMVEMLYQFEQPLQIDGVKFAAAFPDFRYTPHDEAIQLTVDWFREMTGG